MHDTSISLLNVGCRKDDYAFFLQPVDLAAVPNYTDVIARPMDLGTMTTKVEKGKYRSLEEFAVRSLAFYRSDFSPFKTLSFPAAAAVGVLSFPLYSTLRWNVRRNGLKQLKPDPSDIKLHAGLRECGRTTRSHTNLPPHMRIYTAIVLVHFYSCVFNFRLTFAHFVHPFLSLLSTAYMRHEMRKHCSLV